MRNLAIGLLASLYFLLSLGVSVSVHYCMGELEEVHLGAESKHCCCSDSGKLMMDCCDEDIYELDLDTEQQITKADQMIALAFAKAFLSQPNECSSVQQIDRTYTGPDPPPPSSRHFRIRIHSLLFYS